MIERPTVLILGAGASKPYGFPTGEKLLRDIVDIFKHRPLPPLFDSLRGCGFEDDFIKGFVNELNRVNGGAKVEENWRFEIPSAAG